MRDSRMIRFTLTGVLAFLTVFCQTAAATAQTQTVEKQVVSYVSVLTEKGDFISGLKPESFKVYDDKSEKTIISFRQDEPMSVGVLLDASGSMRFQSVEKSKPLLWARFGLALFLVNSHKENDYFFVGFNQNPQMLLDTTQDTKAIQKMLDDAAKIQPAGLTNLYDPLYVAIDKLGKAKHSKRVLLIITDAGENNDSKYKFDDVQNSLKQSGVVVIAVSLLNAEQKYIDLRNFAFLDELTAINGGRSYYLYNEQEVGGAFERVAFEFRSQYSIAVNANQDVPADKSKKEKWHKLNFKIEMPKDTARKFGKIYVRARDGYYLSALQN